MSAAADTQTSTLTFVDASSASTNTTYGFVALFEKEVAVTAHSSSNIYIHIYIMLACVDDRIHMKTYYCYIPVNAVAAYYAAWSISFVFCFL